MAIRLIDDIDKLWKFGETRIAAAGLALSAASPALQAWDAIPDAMKAFMPDTLKAAMPLVIIFAALIGARAFTTDSPSNGTGTQG
jgi:hypothetical protein